MPRDSYLTKWLFYGQTYGWTDRIISIIGIAITTEKTIFIHFTHLFY